MHLDSFEQAQHYARRRLERELSPGLTYHSLEHTRQDVVPAAQVFAAGEGIHQRQRVWPGEKVSIGILAGSTSAIMPWLPVRFSSGPLWMPNA